MTVPSKEELTRLLEEGVIQFGELKDPFYIKVEFENRTYISIGDAERVCEVFCVRYTPCVKMIPVLIQMVHQPKSAELIDRQEFDRLYAQIADSDGKIMFV